MHVSALPYEKNGYRGNAHRNGTENRTLKTVDGVLQLNKPQVREFPFETRVFKRYSRVEEAIESVMLESAPFHW